MTRDLRSEVLEALESAQASHESAYTTVARSKELRRHNQAVLAGSRQVRRMYRTIRRNFYSLTGRNQIDELLRTSRVAIEKTNELLRQSHELLSRVEHQPGTQPK